MRCLKQSLFLAVALSPLVGFCAGCNGNQQIPLADVKTPPPLPPQDRSKLPPAPSGASPDVLPNSR